jgi:hypothetical protein
VPGPDEKRDSRWLAAAISTTVTRDETPPSDPLGRAVAYEAVVAPRLTATLLLTPSSAYEGITRSTPDILTASWRFDG